MHVSPTSAVKQRTMTCKLYREASVFKNARNEDRKTYNNIYCKPDISGTLTWTPLWGKKRGRKMTKKETIRVWLLLLHNFKQIVLKIS